MRARGSEAARVIRDSAKEEACGGNDTAPRPSSAIEYMRMSVAVAAHKNVCAPFHVALAAALEAARGTREAIGAGCEADGSE
jgi:hypothetical protein